MLIRTAIIVTIVFVILIAGIAVFQNRLLYFPDRATISEIVTHKLTAWPDASDFRGLLAEPAVEAEPSAATGAAVGAIRATVLVFHGNAGHAGHRDYYARVLTRLALRVILVEYPGYGPRDGEINEQNLVADAEATIVQTHLHFGEPLLLLGESLGAGVAAAAAARQAGRIAGLLLITPWDRLTRVASHHYPWLPVSLLLRDRYDSAASLADVGKPILVAVAQDDAIVPARFGVALYQGLPQPKKLLVVEAAGHNDWSGHVDSAWWRAAIEWMLPPVESR